MFFPSALTPPLRSPPLTLQTPLLLRQARVSPCRVTRPAEPVYYPGIEEESEVSSGAFHRAFDEARPAKAVVPGAKNSWAEGLQEFAAALWQRRRLIAGVHDPLQQIFNEFDLDNDGVLAARDIASALRSRGVQITDEQAEYLINTYEEDRACVLPCFDTQTISRAEWPNFIYSLTIADLHVADDPLAHGHPSLNSTDSE